VRRGAILLGLALTACGVAPMRDVGAPPVADPLLPAQNAAAPSARPAGPPVGITVTPMQGEEAQPVPPTKLLAGGAPAPRGGPPRPSAASPADITLNFEEADIRDVVGFVLRDVLHRNYVVDPDVTGTISLGVSQPITREALLPLLEAVLNSRGATMIETDGLIRVSLLREGGKLRATPRLVPGGPVGGAPIAGQEAQVFTLHYATPSEIAKLLEPVLAQGRVLMADDARRLLLVQGNQAELDSVRDTLAIFDVDQLANTAIAMVLLHSADVTELVPELTNLFGAARKASDNGVIRFVPIERLNAVIILAREPRYMDEARAWIGRLDRVRRGNEPRLYVYHVQHAKAAEVARTLQDAFARGEAPEATAARATPLPDFPAGGGPASLSDAQNALTQSPVVRSAAMPATPAIPIPGMPVLAPNESPPGIAPRAAGAAPSPGAGGLRIRADEANNSLLVLATPREYAQVQEVLEQIDIPPLQVLIEATVAEVVLNDQLQYGVQYLLNSGRANFLFSRNQVTPPVAITPNTPGFAFSLLNNLGSPRVIIDALSQLTQTNVISTPRLLVIDNQTARLQVGAVVPIVTSTAVSTVTSTPLTVNSVQYRDTGVVIEITPHVNSSGFVTIDTTLSVSDVATTTTSTIDSPTFNERRIRTSAGVQSGSTILLGGLISEDSTHGNSGLPVLGDLPVVGGLFGTRNFVADRTELIVLLTPRVVRNQDEATDMTNAIQRKFQAVLTLDQPGVMPRPRLPQYP
jgi:general secretion pathway protein D